MFRYIKRKLKLVSRIIVFLFAVSVGFTPMYMWNLSLRKQLENKDSEIKFNIDNNVAIKNQESDYERFKKQLETNKSFIESIKNDVKLECTTLTVSKPIYAIKNSTSSTGILGWWEGRKENNIKVKMVYECNYKINYSDLETETDSNGDLLVYYNPQTDFDVTVSVLSAVVLPSDEDKQGFMPEKFSSEELINLFVGNQATLKSEMLNSNEFISKSTSTFEEFFRNFAKTNKVNVKFVDYKLENK